MIKKRFAEPLNNNVKKKEMAKEEHYEQLKYEVNRIWTTKMEVSLVPVVTEAMGIVTENLGMFINRISNNIKQQHKHASLGQRSLADKIKTGVSQNVVMNNLSNTVN